MSDILDSLFPYFATGAGVLVLLGWPYRRRREDTATTPLIEAVCGCEHDLSMHDPTSNRCHERVYLGNAKYGDCRCRQYVGPRPIDQVFQPPFLPPD